MTPEAREEMLVRLAQEQQHQRQDVAVAIGLARRHDERLADSDKRMARLESAWNGWLQEQAENSRRREVELQNAVRWLAGQVRDLEARLDRATAPQPRRRNRPPKPASAREDKATNGGAYAAGFAAGDADASRALNEAELKGYLRGVIDKKAGN